MSTSGHLKFQGTNRATFVGTTSNIMFDTTSTSLGIGVTGTDHPSSNLYITGNAYVSSNIAVGGVLTMGTVNVVARHDLEAVTALGNTTPVTLEFTNPTTSLVASGNVVVTGNVTADYFVGDGSNITGISSTLQAITDSGPGANVTSNTVQFSNAITSLTATSNIEVAGFVGSSGTGALTLPSGTTEQQPSTGLVGGMIRFNSTTNRLEVYNGTAWQSVGGVSATQSAGSGTMTTSGGYKIHTFTSSGDLVVNSGGEVDYLIVAGGGGGGSGGGGAGGMLTGKIASLSPNTYTITVGGGGGGGRGGSPVATPTPSNGTNSTALGLTAIGGGRGGGGSISGRVGSNGGSGGGHGYDINNTTRTTGTSGQGNGGGRASGPSLGGSGGGGGAGGAGQDGGGSIPHGSTSYPSYGGNGGIGLQSSISGTPTYYAGGGGGGLNQNNNITYARPTGQTYGGYGGLGGGGTGTTKGWTSNNVGEGTAQVSPTAGAPNTGGGGGGTDPELDNGAGGGTGIVIISYLL
jgi:hypothetical protein